MANTVVIREVSTKQDRYDFISCRGGFTAMIELGASPLARYA